MIKMRVSVCKKDSEIADRISSARETRSFSRLFRAFLNMVDKNPALLAELHTYLDEEDTNTELRKQFTRFNNGWNANE